MFECLNVNDARLLSARPRWPPPSPSLIQISLKVPPPLTDASRCNRQTSKSTEMRETGGMGGGLRFVEGGDVVVVGGPWGTQQGHLPRAIWWLRRFYTVVFVCLFRLGFLAGSAAGQPSVIIHLPPTSSVLLPSTISTLSLSLSVFFPVFFSLLLSQKSAGGCHCDWLSAVTRGGDGESVFLLITPNLNQWFDSWTFIPLFVRPCLFRNRLILASQFFSVSVCVSIILLKVWTKHTVWHLKQTEC